MLVKRCAVLASMTAAAILFCAGAAPSRAAESVHLQEYRLYQDAFERGDKAAAAAHALAAWKAAETELRDHRTTAVLAYNYGKLVVFEDAAAALPALQRADALKIVAVDLLPTEELELLLAFAEFYSTKRKDKDAAELRRVLQQQTTANISPSPESARIWLFLATEDFAAKRYDSARISAAGAEAAIAAVYPNDFRAIAQAIIIGGASRLVPIPRPTANIEAANLEFERAERLFPPQKDIESFDPILAQALAWDAAAKAALLNRGRKEFRTGCSVGEERCELIRFEGPRPTFEECGIVWKRRKPPLFPEDAAEDGYLGAAIAGFRFGEDTLVHDARILAEIPTNQFGRAALDSMKSWELESPPSDKPGCRGNRVTSFIFSIY